MSSVSSSPSSKPDLAVSLPDYLATQREPLQWVVPGLIPAKGFILLAGSQKVGKTWFGMQLALCLPAGRAFLGRETIQGPVISVLEEGTHEGTADRFRALARHHGTQPDTHLIVRRNVRTDRDDAWASLTHDIRLLRPVLTIIDPLVRIHRMDENKVNEMTPVMEEIQRLTELGSAVLLVHHVSKGSGNESNVGAAARGSGTIVSSTDGNLVLGRDKNGKLVLRTEMRDAEAEAISLDFLPDAGGFEVASPGASAPTADPKSPKDLTPWLVLQMTKAEMDRGQKGLTVKRLQLLATCADGTARTAIALAIKAGVVKEEGPDNGHWYVPAA
jgi:hypothetical protein